MALPGRVNDTYSRGTNQLIASGVASLIRDAGDLIDMMNWPRRPADGVQQQLALDIPEDYVPVLDALKASPDATVNDLCLALAMPFPQLSSLLFRMELDDYVVALSRSDDYCNSGKIVAENQSGSNHFIARYC